MLGYDARGPAVAGKPLDVTVYFEGVEGTPQNVRATLGIVATGDPPVQPPLVSYQRYPAGDGLFPTSKWHPGDWVKEVYPLRIPPSWAGRKARLQLRFYDEKRQPVTIAGARTAEDGKVLVLGEVEVGPP